MLLTVHNPTLKPVLILDNTKDTPLKFFNETLTTDLKSGASVFEFSVYKKSLAGDNPIKHKYSALNERSFISFIYNEETYLFNVMELEENEDYIRCYCESLNLELLNEYSPAFKADKAMTFEEYCKIFTLLKTETGISIGINEVKDKKLTLEWTGQDTKLARLLSLATKFDAEIQFKTHLNNNNTFKKLEVNVYKEYEEGVSFGVGRNRTDIVLRYQKNISGITKKVDKREIYNYIKPSGKRTVKSTRVISKPVIKRVKKKIRTNKDYFGGDLKYYGKTLKKSDVQAIIDRAVRYNILPSGIIVQLYLESNWGNSYVGRKDNNWSGMTGGAGTRPSGVRVSTGSRRPANEGGTYMHYANVSDFLEDYTYLLAKQGIYRVVGKKNINDYTKGLFRTGGAKYDYAAIGYRNYLPTMQSIRNGINKFNGNILDTIDRIWQTPVKYDDNDDDEEQPHAKAFETIKALNEASKLKGRRVGSGQCYALSAWYANRLRGPGLGGGVTSIRGRVGGGIAASRIGSDYAWYNYNWGVIEHPRDTEFLVGSIFNVKANYRGVFFTGPYGHTGIIKSVKGNKVITLEQNFNNMQYVIERSYPLSGFLDSLESICSPSEIFADGKRIDGITAQQQSSGATIDYDEVVQEAKTETYDEEQTFYIDSKVYKEWKNAKGEIEFILKDGALQAPISRNLYPSVLTGSETNDNWIRKDMEVDTDNQEVLISTALKDLKKHAYPAIEYEVDGYADLKVGDVVRIQDDGYQPSLILTARVVKQVLSITDPKRCKTTFSNFTEHESEISSDLISDMLDMYDQSIPYEINLSTTNGIAFKNGTGESRLEATLSKSGKECDAMFFFRNTDTEALLGTGSQFLVSAIDFEHVLNITVEAYVSEELVASTQISCTDTEDGTKGKDGSGLVSTEITYAEGTNGTTVPTTATWLSSPPEIQDGNFLWTRTIWKYSDGTSKTGYSVSKMGERGADGIPGKDGVGIKSTDVTYGLSDSEDNKPLNWSSQVPKLVKGKYLWTQSIWHYSDGSSETGYQKTYIAKDGNDGNDGIPGKDGVGIISTTITYAEAPTGVNVPVSAIWTVSPPNVKDGWFLWTRNVWQYSDGTSETGYSVSKMGERGLKGDKGDKGERGLQGLQGERGIKGERGEDGRTQYTHIAYADDIYGNGFSQNNANKKCIGMYQDFNEIDSSDPSKYRWSHWKGRDGADGVPGPPGEDGRTPYIHFAYSNSSDGRKDFSTSETYDKCYLGTYTDFTKEDSLDPSRYKWVYMVGTVDVGGGNLIRNSAFPTEPWENTQVTTHDFYFNGTKTLFALKTTGQSTANTSSNYFDVKRNTDYSLSFIAFSSQTDSACNMFFLGRKVGETAEFSSYVLLFQDKTFNTMKAEYITVTFNSGENDNGKIEIDYSSTDNQPSYIYFTEVMLVEGKTPRRWQISQDDVDDNINAKADDKLTTEQINALMEQTQLHEVELKAKASLEQLSELERKYQEFVTANAENKKQSEADLIRVAGRVSKIVLDIGEQKELKKFIDTYMSSSNEGLVIGKNDSSSTIKVSSDRISMFSAGSEVMYISKGVIHIENGIFSKTVQIGKFREEQYYLNENMNVIRFLG